MGDCQDPATMMEVEKGSFNEQNLMIAKLKLRVAARLTELIIYPKIVIIIVIAASCKYLLYIG